MLHAICITVAYILTNNFIIWYLWHWNDCPISGLWPSISGYLAMPKEEAKKSNWHCDATHGAFLKQKNKEQKTNNENPVMLVTKHGAVCHHFHDCQVILFTS